MKELAERFTELLKANDSATIYRDLYSPDVVSIEADGQAFHGLAGIEGKNAWWEENFEMHGFEIEGPFPAHDGFAMIYTMDVTHRPSGSRMTSKEVAVYDVVDGKVVKEQFYYVGGM